MLGKEIQEVLQSRKAGAVIVPYSATGEGNFGDQEGEPVYLEPLNAASIAGHDAIVVAGSAQGAQKVYELAKAAGGKPIVIDCTGQLEQHPEARILAPLSESSNAPDTWLLIVAHPAASALALLLEKLARYRAIKQAVVHIFEPASERGKRGVSELHQQTTNLLTFKSLDKAIYDAQLAFNLLSQYGEEAPQKLAAVEQRIEHHVATLLASHSGQSAPMPSLRVIQAPVFHGYSLSLWIEFASDIEAAELGESLASAQIEVRGQNEEAPNSVGVASQSGLIAGDIRVDHNNPRAAWFWLVCDNLRVMGDAVADLVVQFGAKQQ